MNELPRQSLTKSAGMGKHQAGLCSQGHNSWRGTPHCRTAIGRNWFGYESLSHGCSRTRSGRDFVQAITRVGGNNSQALSVRATSSYVIARSLCRICRARSIYSVASAMASINSAIKLISNSAPIPRLELLPVEQFQDRSQIAQVSCSAQLGGLFGVIVGAIHESLAGASL